MAENNEHDLAHQFLENVSRETAKKLYGTSYAEARKIFLVVLNKYHGQQMALMSKGENVGNSYQFPDGSIMNIYFEAPEKVFFAVDPNIIKH